jgi:hypothetical protein
VTARHHHRPTNVTEAFQSDRYGDKQRANYFPLVALRVFRRERSRELADLALAILKPVPKIGHASVESLTLAGEPIEQSQEVVAATFAVKVTPHPGYLDASSNKEACQPD